MLIGSHLRIADRVIKDTDADLHGICRVAFMFGNIAPDTYLIVKRHQYTSTMKNVKHHINKINKHMNDAGIVYYLRLGMIMHYACDYYCKAHNELSIIHGIKHTKYEIKLGRFIRQYHEKINNIHCSENNMIDMIENNHIEYANKLKSKNWSLNMDYKTSMKVAIALMNTYAVH